MKAVFLQFSSVVWWRLTSAAQAGRSVIKSLLVLLVASLILEVRAVAGLEADIPQTNRVILSSGRWKPSAEETRKALAAIQTFLERPSTNAWENSEIPKILKHTKEYRVQFFGIVRDGNRLIRCNFFPAPRQGEQEHYQDWQRQEIMVLDGGFWFWQVEYEPSTGKCLNFTSNGDA